MVVMVATSVLAPASAGRRGARAPHSRRLSALSLVTLAFALGGCGDDAPTATSRPVLSVTTQAQNLVINPGFENGT